MPGCFQRRPLGPAKAVDCKKTKIYDSSSASEGIAIVMALVEARCVIIIRIGFGGIYYTKKIIRNPHIPTNDIRMSISELLGADLLILGP